MTGQGGHVYGPGENVPLPLTIHILVLSNIQNDVSGLRHRREEKHGLDTPKTGVSCTGSVLG